MLGKDARRFAGRAKRALSRRGLRRYYRSQLREPVDPDLVVFAAYWYRGYACNPKAIYEKLRELVPSARGVWIVGRKHAETMPDGVEYVIAGTRDYFRAIARAKYLVNNVNFPDELVKREGTIHVQTHHGTPLKKMGLDLRGALVAGKRMDFEALLRRCARWDYSITANSHSTEIFERVYPTDYETLEVGYPRNDVLAAATASDVEGARARLGVPAGKRTLLYAPTHREYLEGFEPTFDLVRFVEALGPSYVLLVRLHYFQRSDERLRALHEAGRIVDVSRHPSVEEVCLAADVLITDYSALMFDYAVLDRPIVIHAPDWEEYRRLRGTYLDLFAEGPGVATRADEELIAAFRDEAVWGEVAARTRAAFRARFCALDDGHAAERVVRRVWMGEGQDAAAPERAATERVGA
jgi:CDP-glycerol glycerophosphotransferase